MRNVFQAELHQINDELIQISTLVSEAIDKAVAALDATDLDLAQEVIAGDARIDFLEKDLDERSIDILARQAPVAGDLRMVVASLRISASLERMGDLARHLAQLTRLRYPDPVIPESLRPAFLELGSLDTDIARRIGALLATHDLEITSEIAAANAKVNEVHARMFQAVSAETWHEGPARAVDVILASRYHERFADHAVAITHKVAYLVSGQWRDDATREA
ncbi:phosphate signaling complex protein PhoU [Sinomonas sp. G460-2]|uniref:phosphate signaling complex protein PhoU n=1 Tax=Sinomonas sp. G460-2 TaxID=3393464 RepID=UPI0039F13732